MYSLTRRSDLLSLPVLTQGTTLGGIPLPQFSALLGRYAAISTSENHVECFSRPRLLVRPGQNIETNGRETMLRLIAVAFALTLASSAQALPPVSFLQPDQLVVSVREACGAGMHMVNGVCVRTHARRAASRCVRGRTC